MSLRTSTTSLAIFSCLLLFSGCLKDQCERTQEFVRYDPVYLTEDGMRVNVVAKGPQELEDPGNLYYYNGYLLINERLKGVHVIDNSDPSNPQPVAFYEIPGNRDIAVRNNTLYADMFIDLVALNISDIMNPVLECRVENVFHQYYSNAGLLGYIVDYVPTNEVIQIDCSDDRSNSWWWRGGDDVLWLSASNIDIQFDATNEFNGSSSESTGNGGNAGIGGSMARFTLTQDFLYTLDMSQMHVFDVSAACPSKTNTVDMQWGIETLFPYGEYLFVGTTSGMLIYDNTNPELPVFLSQFSHAQACDPVFVSEDIAYVTLRDGTTCQNFINQLDVIDVSNIANPTLIRTYPMQHPHGLSVANNTLFLCEGQFGVKVFDVENKEAIADNRLSWIQGLNAFDVIVLGDVAMVIGSDGLYQYDISDRAAPSELSVIPIGK